MKNQEIACHGHGSEASLFDELVHHFPYAVFSVSLSFIVLSFLLFVNTSAQDLSSHLHILFHNCHLMHLVFAIAGSLVMFFKFSKNILKGVVVSVISGLIFCTLSDVIFPYIAGSMLGVHMHLHICLISEFYNVLPFLVVGLLTGLAMSQHQSNIHATSVVFHFGHIFVSSLASLFYLVGEGFSYWYQQIGIIFLLLVLAVVIPCTCADVIIPVLFAKGRKKNEKH